MQIIYCYNHEGYFLGQSVAQEDPIAGGLLMPPNTVLDEPPSYDETHLPKWNGSSWDVVDSPYYIAEQARIAAEAAAAEEEANRLAAEEAAVEEEEAHQVEVDAAQAAEALVDINMAKTHLLYNNVTGEILHFKPLFTLTNGSRTETVPRLPENGLPIDDEANSEISELVFDPEVDVMPDEETEVFVKNSYDIKLKKISEGAIADRTQEEIDAESDPIAEIGYLALRTSKLYKTDWVVSVTDSGISQEIKDEWVTYRQALRDLPPTVTDPKDVTWPTPPVAPEIKNINT